MTTIPANTLQPGSSVTVRMAMTLDHAEKRVAIDIIRPDTQPEHAQALECVEDGGDCQVRRHKD